MEERITMATMALTRVGSVLITCVGQTPHTDADVEKMLARFSIRDYQTLLFSVRGPGPNSKQRARIADYWKQSGRKTPRTLVLTESAPARFVAQVITMLLGTEAKCTAPSDLEAGLAYLGHPAPLAEVAGCLAALHVALDVKQRHAG